MIDHTEPAVARAALHPRRPVVGRRVLRLCALGALLIALVSSAVPSFGGCCRCRDRANESAAIATLKNLASAQGQLQRSAVIDVDGDGRGEFGFFAELAGAAPLRALPVGSAATLATPVMSSAFAKVRQGRVQRSGYEFALFLPAFGGGWLGEAASGGTSHGITTGVDPTRAHREWIAYAWPTHFGRTGRRAFCITWQGDVLATDMKRESYSGAEAPPPGVAAFRCERGALEPAANTVDVRGNSWVIVK